MNAPIDLRSDTVTRPTAEMRQAMASADVGDDVYGEDPTVRALEERVADIVGMEAALFVPSGSMANQLCIKVHTRPGDEVLAGKFAHCLWYEAGGAAAVAGVQVNELPGDGRFTADDVKAACKPDNHHHGPSTLLALENTHNMGGGIIWDPAAQRAAIAAARELGLRVHLDGARLWNAAQATGTPERDLCQGVDSVSVCLSKGLGAPVGSLVAGSKDVVYLAHRYRKMLGGGMRQAGILAAGGLYALEHHRDRLPEDHANARHLAERLNGVNGWTVDVSRVATNIVMVDVPNGTATQLATRAKEQGVLFGAISDHRFRLVTHLDVSRQDVETAVERLASLT